VKKKKASGGLLFELSNVWHVRAFPARVLKRRKRADMDWAKDSVCKLRLKEERVYVPGPNGIKEEKKRKEVTIFGMWVKKKEQALPTIGGKHDSPRGGKVCKSEYTGAGWGFRLHKNFWRWIF